VWRRTRDTFYSKGYHGIDWIGIRPIYGKYLPHIGNNYEFAEMMAEMLGELNISHSGSTYASSTPNDDATASLGLFLDQSYVGPGVKVTEVIKDGPLDRVGVDLKPGMLIESVDGRAIGQDKDIAEFLNRKAGKNVLLSVADGASKTDVVVKPVAAAEENRLLYARWVWRQRGRGRQGEQQPRLCAHSRNERRYVSFYVQGHRRRYATRKAWWWTRASTAAATSWRIWRCSGGKKFFDYTTDTRAQGTSPTSAGRSRVALANGANYSDGHCFAYAYKDQKIGPLVGMPTPGTCTFAGWESLQDGLR
jgi:C-terminal processing protease CtpA/Prc